MEERGNLEAKSSDNIQNEDNPKNGDDLKYEKYTKNEDNLKKWKCEGYLRIQDKPKDEYDPKS